MKNKKIARVERSKQNRRCWRPVQCMLAPRPLVHEHKAHLAECKRGQTDRAPPPHTHKHTLPFQKKKNVVSTDLRPKPLRDGAPAPDRGRESAHELARGPARGQSRRHTPVVGLEEAQRAGARGGEGRPAAALGQPRAALGDTTPRGRPHTKENPSGFGRTSYGCGERCAPFFVDLAPVCARAPLPRTLRKASPARRARCYNGSLQRISACSHLAQGLFGEAGPELGAEDEGLSVLLGRALGARSHHEPGKLAGRLEGAHRPAAVLVGAP